MSAIGVALLVGAPHLNRAASRQVLDDLDALGADIIVVNDTPEYVAAVLPGAHHRSNAVGIQGATLLATAVGTARPTSLSADPPVRVTVVGVSNLGDTRILPSGIGHDLDSQGATLLRGIAGSHAVRILGLVELPAIVWLDNTAILVIGTIADSLIAPQLVRSVIVDGPTLEQAVEIETRQLLVRADPGAADNVRIVNAANPLHPERVSIAIPGPLLDARQNSERSLSLLTTAISALSAIVAAATLSILLAASVRQRAAEIGVRRCLGAKTRDLLTLIATEGLILGLAGTAVGLAVGYFGALTYATIQDWPWATSTSTLAAAAVLGAATGLLGGIPPAIVAARIDPASAVAQNL